MDLIGYWSPFCGVSLHGLYISLYMHIHVCEDAHALQVHTCVNAREGSYPKVLLAYFKNHFWDISSLTWSLPSRIGWIATESQVSACLCFPNTRITNVCYHNDFLMGVLGLNHRSSCLQCMTNLRNWAVSPAPHMPFWLLTCVQLRETYRVHMGTEWWTYWIQIQIW